MDLPARIEASSAFLHTWRPLWTERPFEGPVSWAADHRALVGWLTARSDAELSRLETARIPGLPHAPWLADARALTRLPTHPRAHTPWPERWGDAMPARKWAQIRAFASALPRLPAELVDWCAGKSHLGRTLARAHGARVTALEVQGPLCVAGAALADALPVSFVHGDALSTDAAGVLAPERAVVALHACGHLTDALLDRATDRGAALLAVAPCCCHNQPRSGWSPRATVTRQVAPPLPRDALRLATAEDIDARDPGRLRAMAFRLGLDLLLRDATGVDQYRDVPRLPGPVLAGPFEGFARAGAAAVGVDLGAFDPVRTEAAGWARAREVRALDLVRGTFRRVIELVVWLDRARWLEERGWTVQVGTFCRRAVTPRNLLILARP